MVDPVHGVVVDRAAVLGTCLLTSYIELGQADGVKDTADAQLGRINYRISDCARGVAINIILTLELGQNIKEARYDLEGALGSTQTVPFATEDDESLHTSTMRTRTESWWAGPPCE